jgi:outer membrane immunogenic protein
VYLRNEEGIVMYSLVRAQRVAFALALSAAPILTALNSEARADPLAPIWTGAYIGAHAGGLWSDIDTTSFGSVSSSDLAAGGHAGFNVGLGGLVAGVEGDIGYAGSDLGFSTLNGGSANLSTDWNGSLRARLGMPVGPALLYATAGYAWNATTLTQNSPTGATTDVSHTFGGVVYGVGAEAYVLPNMSLRLEALHYDYSADSLSLDGAAAAAQEIDPSETVVRAGVTFHLN